MNTASGVTCVLSHHRGVRSPRSSTCIGIVAVLLLAWWAQRPIPAHALLQTGDVHATAHPSDPAAPNVTSAAKDPQTYGLWVLTPAIAAILITILTRQVLAALFIGVLVGAFMYVPCLGPDAPFKNAHGLIAGTRLAMERYIIGGIHQFPSEKFERIKILVFTLLVAFMVGVIGRNGGTAGMVRVVAGESSSRRRGSLTAWFAGLVVFFDDYANCMIIGPTMRPIFDRLKLSRALLAYIIDSTAAPVASLAIIGTWIGAEISYISDGLKLVADSGMPAFLISADGKAMTGMAAFMNSLPYRFYPILALAFVFFVCLLGRDFGPMRTSQSRALSRGDPDRPAPTMSGTTTSEAPPTWWLGFVPVAVLVVVTLVVLAVTGLAATDSQQALRDAKLLWWEKGAKIVGSADSYISILYGALLASLSAVFLTLFARTCKLRHAMDAGLDSMSRTFPALVILVLAWALSQVEQDLMLGQVLTDQLRAVKFPPLWLPLAIFVVSSIIAFATGTSWGTMGIVCPITVPMAAGLAESLPPTDALTLFYASVGSVLAGSVFGDHCSPISDTTVLSSIGADCPHVEHVWTQMPYAIVTALVSMAAGNVMCNVYGLPWYYAIAAGIVVIALTVSAVGRRATPNFHRMDA